MKFQYLVIHLLLVASCASPPRESGIDPIFVFGKPIALSLSGEEFAALPADSIGVFLKGATDQVLGSLSRVNNSWLFTPVVPLTPGSTYEVRRGSMVLASVTLDFDDSLPVPLIQSFHPSGDSLAENTLKAYLRFSEPMAEGNALKHIVVIRNDTDTLQGTFLDLQPELWNEDGTILTLWFDPGRVKRDLIPNKVLGNPLDAGSRYKLVVTKGWRSRLGKGTDTAFEKNFIAIGRDEKSPDPKQWVITPPQAGTTDDLKIVFHEKLDYLVVINAVKVIGPDGIAIAGEMVPGKGEVMAHFKPVASWKTGMYMLQVEPRLEDPAGNNLSRLFDQDITKVSGMQPSEPVLVQFEVP